MATPGPRGIPYQFNGNTFRNAIRFVMEMGTDPVEANQVRFHFLPVVTNAAHADGDKVPFDPTKAPVKAAPAPVKVPCVAEFTAATEVPTEFGTVIPAKVTCMLLDGNYQLVKDAAYITMNGDRYNRLYETPSYGLFDVGIHTLVFQAENEI